MGADNKEIRPPGGLQSHGAKEMQIPRCGIYDMRRSARASRQEPSSLLAVWRTPGGFGQAKRPFRFSPGPQCPACSSSIGIIAAGSCHPTLSVQSVNFPCPFGSFLARQIFTLALRHWLADPALRDDPNGCRTSTEQSVCGQCP